MGRGGGAGERERGPAGDAGGGAYGRAGGRPGQRLLPVRGDGGGAAGHGASVCVCAGGVADLEVFNRSWDEATAADVEAFKEWRLTEGRNGGRVAPT
jgi:hypothetical protein